MPPAALCTNAALLPQDAGSYGVRHYASPRPSQALGRNVALTSSGHMLTPWLQGPLGKLGSGFLCFLVEVWLSSLS